MRGVGGGECFAAHAKVLIDARVYVCISVHIHTTRAYMYQGVSLAVRNKNP